MNDDLSEIRTLLKEITGVLRPMAHSLKRLVDIASKQQHEYEYSDLNVDADE